MGLKDYFRGRLLVLHSPFPVEEVADCIRAGSGSFYWFVDHAVSSGMWMVRLRFNYVKHPFSYNATPVLDMSAKQAASGTDIHLNHVGPGWVLAGAIFFYGFLSVLMGVFIVSAMRGGAFGQEFGLMAALFAWAILIPLVHSIAIRRADRDLERVVHLLADKAQARLVDGTAAAAAR